MFLPRNRLFVKKPSIIKILTILFFLLFSLIALREIIFSSSYIGFNQDWSFPMTNQSLKLYCQRSLFIWTNTENLGYNYVYPAGNLFRYLVFPLLFLGLDGLVVIKLVLLLVFTFGGYFMFLLLRNSFKLGYLPSLISGFFYVITPLVFNKLVAGHSAYLIAYALSPIIMAFFIKYTTTHEIKNLIITSLLLSFATIQLQFVVMLVILFFFYAIMIAKMKISALLKTFFFILLFIVLVHLFWLLPASFNLASLFAALQSASNINNLGTWSTSLSNAFRMLVYRSPHFEIALSNYSFKNLWDIVSFLLVIVSFGSLLVTKSRIPLFFGAVSVVTLIFTAATGPFAVVVYYLYLIFPIFNVFREVYHLVFLISFSYSVMLAFFLQSIYNSKRLKRYFKFLLILVIVGMVIFYDPFIYSGDFSGQVQRYQLDNQNLTLINKYLNLNGDYRVLYLPMVQPFKYDGLTYYGTDPEISYSEKPTIGNYIDSNFLNNVALFSYMPSSNLTNILNILSVKYVFLRNDFESMVPLYLSEGQLSVENGSYDIRPIWTNDNLFKNIQNQQNLKLLSSTENLSVFENNDFLPHIYPATIPIAVDGSNPDLFSLLLSPAISNLDNKAIFLSGQLDQGQWQFIKNNNNTCFVGDITKDVQSYDGTEKSFNWAKMQNDTIEMRYYSGWKSVIRTDGQENEDTLSFPSLNATPYTFPSGSTSGWNAFDSTLIYIRTGEKPLRINQMFENGAPMNVMSSIIGIWWKNDWVGMGTKPMQQYPIVIPANQRAIIQCNHIIKGNVMFQTIDLNNLSLNQAKLAEPPAITFQKVNPTKYEVRVENAAQPFFLVFNENYSPQWKAYVESRKLGLDEVIASYQNTNVNEANHETSFTPADISYVFTKPLNENNHFIVNGYANAWYIDPAQMSNGSEEFTITLYYLPQSFFYLGLFATGFTVVACVGYLVFNFEPFNRQIKKRFRILLNRIKDSAKTNGADLTGGET